MIAKAFASTQAAWRFYQNERVTLPQLARPLLAAGRKAVSEQCDDYVLVVHDWSNLHYTHHAGKKDRVELSQSKDLGYELQAALLASDRTGAPLAPVSLSLRAADGVHCSRQATVRQPLSSLDELAPAMTFVEKQKFAKPAVHVIDAEADSVGHYRQWLQQPQRLFLVRADAVRVVRYQGRSWALSKIRQQLRKRNAFCRTRPVRYKGKTAWQWVAEVPVVLTRPARPQRNGQKRKAIPGPPAPLRLVITELRDSAGKPLEVWYLLSNVPEKVPAATLALWYYFRWRIEDYFKLLKSAGQELEHWQQADAATIAKRLLIASMACVIVWQLMQSNAPQAEEARQLLVRLSGRQMKRARPFTAPALLAGLWVLLSVLYVLDHYPLKDLHRIAANLFPDARASPVKGSKLV